MKNWKVILFFLNQANHPSPHKTIYQNHKKIILIMQINRTRDFKIVLIKYKLTQKIRFQTNSLFHNQYC